jgi:hypothetical protein
MVPHEMLVDTAMSVFLALYCELQSGNYKHEVELHSHEKQLSNLTVFSGLYAGLRVSRPIQETLKVQRQANAQFLLEKATKNACLVWIDF